MDAVTNIFQSNAAPSDVEDLKALSNDLMKEDCILTVGDQVTVVLIGISITKLRIQTSPPRTEGTQILNLLAF
jgi:hypothetical protein